jgi:hypothetical protein
MFNEEQALSWAQEWIDAWNRRDIDAIIRHYGPHVEFRSPFVRALCGEPSGTLRGRASLQAYFQQGLAAYPELRFELLRVLTGVDSMLLYYRSVNGLLAAETMIFNREGEIESVRVHYAKE